MIGIMLYSARVSRHGGGKEVMTASDDGLTLTIKKRNKVIGVLIVEDWGEQGDTFTAINWYPRGDMNRGEQPTQ